LAKLAFHVATSPSVTALLSDDAFDEGGEGASSFNSGSFVSAISSCLAGAHKGYSPKLPTPSSQFPASDVDTNLLGLLGPTTRIQESTNHHWKYDAA